MSDQEIGEDFVRRLKELQRLNPKLPTFAEPLDPKTIAAVAESMAKESKWLNSDTTSAS